MDISLSLKSKKINIKSISEPISSELKEFKTAYRKSMQTDQFLINRISGYMTTRHGKMLRPILILLSAKLFGKPNKDTISSAVLVELLHAATLIHDDVVDRAERRRGIPAVHSIWKNKISVLMGDFLFSRALIKLVRLRNFDALDVLSRTAERMSKGELLQMEKNRSNGMDEETYFKMISDKTASLFSASCEMGTLTTTNSLEYREAMALYGEHLGIAFQLKDDLFDFSEKKIFTGKPVGGDVKENLMTLPVIHSLSNRNRKAGKMVKILRSKRGKKEYKDLVNFVKDNGGLAYTEEKLLYHSKQAVDSLTILDAEFDKDALIDFVQFNLERTK